MKFSAAPRRGLNLAQKLKEAKKPALHVLLKPGHDKQTSTLGIFLKGGSASLFLPRSTCARVLLLSLSRKKPEALELLMTAWRILLQLASAKKTSRDR